MVKVTDICKKSNLYQLNLTEKKFLSFISQHQLTLYKEMTQYQLRLIKHNKNLMFYSMFKTVSKRWVGQVTAQWTIPRTKKGYPVSKFCLGNHQSRIETGRQTIPKTPEYIRIWPRCNLKEVEHECILYLPGCFTIHVIFAWGF